MAKLDRLLARAGEHLEADETVVSAIDGTYETEIFGADSTRSGVLIATDQRLVFYAKKVTGYDLESFPYGSISSFEQSKNMMGGNVKFIATGNAVSMKWIKAENLREFTREVKSRMGAAKAPAAPAAAEPDIPDQIRKLGELHTAGILGDDEFESKEEGFAGPDVTTATTAGRLPAPIALIRASPTPAAN